MNNLQKFLSMCLLATAALFGGAFPAFAADAPLLGAASEFAILGGTAVTCTDGSVVIGDVGLSPGTAFTSTSCTLAGGTPPATNAAAALARTAFLSAYAALAPQPGDCDVAHTLPSTITGPVTLLPGVYCTDAALTGTGVLTLKGSSTDIWIFKIGTSGTGALTGTNFSVVMADGGQPCNVYWWVAEAATMNTSAFTGNILAGGDTGSITFTGGTLAGRALAKVAVTMTGINVIGCDALSDFPSCKPKKHHGRDKDKCNQGVGNRPEGCDPGHSDEHSGSNDENGGTPGNPGRKGGNK